MSELAQKHCVACEGGTPPLADEKITTLLTKLDGWEISEDNKSITKSYSFKNFLRTMSFVNAIAWIANQENHHPDLEIGYNYCRVHFSTHAINGLSENDFICAAKIDILLNK